MHEWRKQRKYICFVVFSLNKYFGITIRQQFVFVLNAPFFIAKSKYVRLCAPAF